ncbi:MAG: 4Fe-4S single cluster domain-containing protein, partial [Polyangiales bacterium]
MLRVAQRVPSTFAEGPGLRYALWVQGCTLRCAGCCNPEMFPREGGEAISIESLLAHVLAQSVEGISLLGGEPFEQAEACAELARGVRAAGRSVMVFTGYRIEEIEGSPL